jgi:hypothetical protein
VFLDAVEREFGPIIWDLAATQSQRVTNAYLGPDQAQPEWRDALSCKWDRLPCTGLRWLNPPYTSIAPWAERCALYGSARSPIAFLVPMSMGTNWYWTFCAPHSRTFAVSRMMFVERLPDGTERPACYDRNGKPTNYPKDLMLCVFGMSPGVERWQWRKAA